MPLVINGLCSHLHIPENMRPVGIIIMGYPDETPAQPENRWHPEKIHWGKW